MWVNSLHTPPRLWAHETLEKTFSIFSYRLPPLSRGDYVASQTYSTVDTEVRWYGLIYVVQYVSKMTAIDLVVFKVCRHAIKPRTKEKIGSG